MMRSQPRLREDRLLRRELVLGALVHAPADRRVLALVVLAHDPEVDVAGLAVGERAGHAGHEAHRAQVHVLAGTRAGSGSAGPRARRGRARRESPRRRGRSRRARGSASRPSFGHHLAVLRVVLAAPRLLVPREREAELAARGLEHAQALGHDFLADAVAGDHRDAVDASFKSLPPRKNSPALGRGRVGHFFGNVVAAGQRLAAHIIGHAPPFVERLEAALRPRRARPTAPGAAAPACGPHRGRRGRARGRWRPRRDSPRSSRGSRSGVKQRTYSAHASGANGVMPARPRPSSARR